MASFESEQSKLDELQRTIAQRNDELDASIAQKATVDAETEIARAANAEIDAEVSAATGRLTELSHDIAAAEMRMSEAQKATERADVNLAAQVERSKAVAEASAASLLGNETIDMASLALSTDGPLSQDLDRLPNIGGGMIWHLNRAGILTLKDLASANAEELKSKLGVIGQLAKIDDWIVLAREHA